MHVNKCQNVFVLRERHVLFVVVLFGAVGKLVNNLLDGAHSGVNAEVRLVVPAVEVVARHRCPVVPNYDTIRVDHRDDFEYHSLAELSR